MMFDGDEKEENLIAPKMWELNKYFSAEQKFEKPISSWQVGETVAMELTLNLKLGAYNFEIALAAPLEKFSGEDPTRLDATPTII